MILSLQNPIVVFKAGRLVDSFYFVLLQDIFYVVLGSEILVILASCNFSQRTYSVFTLPM